MSEFSSVSGTRDDFVRPSVSRGISRSGSARRMWVAPTLAPHSTLTELTQTPLRTPLTLLFQQSSVQCFNHLGENIPC